MDDTRIIRRCQLEMLAACMTVGSIHTQTQLVAETKRTYKFIKGGIGITIPKKMVEAECREYGIILGVRKDAP